MLFNFHKYVLLNFDKFVVFLVFILLFLTLFCHCHHSKCFMWCQSFKMYRYLICGLIYVISWKMSWVNLRRMCIPLLDRVFCVYLLGPVVLFCSLNPLSFHLLFSCSTESEVLKYPTIVQSYIPLQFCKFLPYIFTVNYYICKCLKLLSSCSITLAQLLLINNAFVCLL